MRAAFRDYGRFSSRNNFSTESDAPLPAMITQLDPPAHTRLRVLMPAFMPPAVAALEDDIRSVVVGVVDSLPESQTVDVMSTIARVVPGRVVYQIIGLPECDMTQLQSWADVINSVVPAPVVELPAFQALTGYLANVIATRRSSPSQPDDLAGRLLAAETDGRSLTDQEVLGPSLAAHCGGDRDDHQPDRQPAVPAALGSQMVGEAGCRPVVGAGRDRGIAPPRRASSVGPADK